MASVRIWGEEVLVMGDTCRLCGCGSGISVLSTGEVFRHAQRALTPDGCCDDCSRLLARCRTAGRRPPRPDPPLRGRRLQPDLVAA